MRTSKAFVSLLILFFAISCKHAVKRTPSSPKQTVDNPKIREVENGLLKKMEHYSVPGVSIAVINEGKIEWAKGYGFAEKGRPVTDETLFQAASISKPVATLGALVLVENGTLRLDEPVNQKLKSWRVPENKFTKARPITLQQILTHSAGFNVHGFDGYKRKKRQHLPTLEQILNGTPPANSEAVQVIYTPGKRYSYSGGGFEVMQELISDVMQTSFDPFMQSTVLQPLQMNSSTYEIRPSRGQLATGHNKKGKPIPGKWHEYPESAAAGLWTTPTDLSKFILEVQNALKNQSRLGISQTLALSMTSPLIEERGLGVVVKGNGPDRYFTHSGSNKGFKCLFVGFAERGLGAVVMTNGEQGGELEEEIMKSIAKAYQWPNY